MNTTAEGVISEELFLDRVAALCAVAGFLAPLGASLLLAVHLDICSDSRTFSRLFGIAHALVLREVTELAGNRGLLSIVGRNPRSQRTEFALTEVSKALLLRVVSMNPKQAG
ncbi:hypothetical protein [Hyphomicrobium sp.]|uniref:hypothetical protein n=1 Tax=Hyphomicrobium sp. TaxID=82 RepID=UPI0025BFF0E5|nr:hypothetical protein [Hyphomicrobium sp.]MCC7254016.1 hypothetical protein [Hyphomicrobium sp.]